MPLLKSLGLSGLGFEGVVFLFPGPGVFVSRICVSVFLDLGLGVVGVSALASAGSVGSRF